MFVLDEPDGRTQQRNGSPPAVERIEMRLLGEWNWWLPRSLARILPKVELEKEVHLTIVEPEKEVSRQAAAV